MCRLVYEPGCDIFKTTHKHFPIKSPYWKDDSVCHSLPNLQHMTPTKIFHDCFWKARSWKLKLRVLCAGFSISFCLTHSWHNCLKGNGSGTWLCRLVGEFLGQKKQAEELKQLSQSQWTWFCILCGQSSLGPKGEEVYWLVQFFQRYSGKIST